MVAITPRRTHPWRIAGSLALLGLLCLLAYGTMFPNGFVWDDAEYLVHYKPIHTLWPPGYLTGAPGPGFPWLGQRPVTALTFAVDEALWRGHPFGFHLTSLLLHFLCTVGLFFLTHRFFQSEPAAWAAAALFAVHPGHGEAVVAFVGRSDLLATALVLGASLAYLHSWQTRRGPLLFALSLGCFSLGVLAKETALAFLGLVFLLECLRPQEGRPFRKSALFRILPFLLVAGLYWGYRHAILVREPTRLSAWATDPVRGIGVLLSAFYEYLRLFLFPLRLSPWYDASTMVRGWAILALAGLLGASLVILMIARFWRTNRGMAVALSWFLVGLAPVLGGWLLPMLGLRTLGGLPGTVVAERWLYLPSVGGGLFLGGVFAQGWFRAPPSLKRLLAVSGTVLLLLLAWKQAAWNAVWRNEESIARAIVSSAPHSALGYYNLGNALSRQGNAAEAEACYRQAIRLRPDYAKAYNNLGIVLARLGKKDEATQMYREAIRWSPGDAEPHNNLGNLHADQGRGDEAEREYREALRLDPEYPEAHYNLGTLFEDQKLFPEAEREYQEAIRLRPGYVQAHNNLGNVFARQGDYFRAEREYRVAIRLDSLFAGPCINLALVLVRQGRREEAVGILEAFLSQGGQPRAQVEALLRDLKAETISGK
jgi:protein O-mannosyl-transferase